MARNVCSLHQDKEAFGVCRSCRQLFCRECLIERGDYYSCHSPSCESDTLVSTTVQLSAGGKQSVAMEEDLPNIQDKGVLSTILALCWIGLGALIFWCYTNTPVPAHSLVETRAQENEFPILAIVAFLTAGIVTWKGKAAGWWLGIVATIFFFIGLCKSESPPPAILLLVTSATFFLALCSNPWTWPKHVITDDVNGSEENGLTPLMKAAAHGQVNLMRILIDQGANVNAADEDGNTPLHLACINNQLEAARILVDRGADVLAQNSFAEAPFDIVKRLGNKKIAGLLRHHGVEV